MSTEAKRPISRFLVSLLPIRAVRIGLIALVLILVLYIAFGFWMVPRLVRSNLTDFARENYQRELKIGDIRFNPFSLVLELRDLWFADADGPQMLGFKRLMLDFDVSSVWRVGASFAAVELDEPFVRVFLRRDGSLNLADLAKLKQPEKPEPPDAEPARVWIDRLSVGQGRVAFEDRARAKPFSTELRPITFELRDFGTGGESGNAYSLHGASVTGETFAWSGNFELRPLTSNGKFEVAALKATTIWSYLSEALPFVFTKGTLDLNGEYFYAADENGGLRFDVHKIGIADFGMRPPGKEFDYVEVSSLTLEDSKINVRTRQVDVGKARLDGGALRVSRDAEGRLNLSELAGPETPAAPENAPTPAPTTPPPATSANRTAPNWVVAVPDIAVSGVRVDVEDRLVKPAATFALSPVAFTMTGFTTAPASTFQIDGTAKGEKAGELRVKLQTGLDTDAFTGRVEVNEFNLSTLQSYLATYTQTTLNSGWLSAGMDIENTAEGVFNAKGDVTVNKLALVDNALKQELLKWERVTASGIEYGSQPARLNIARIDARAPYARLIIAPDQTLNISQLFTPPGSAPAPPAVQTVRDAAGERHAPAGNPAEMRTSIGLVKVIGGSANFADFWIKPNYAVSLQELAGSISGLSSDPKSRARLDLKGRVDRYAPAEISGDINLLSAALYTDVHVKFDGVEMTSVTPYSGHFAGYEIEKGKLSIDVTYQVEDRKLSAKQKFVIDQLQLGAKVESPDAVRLPLKLAVALLKDRNGVIDIDLPLTGSLDDPQFRMGPLIWKAFVGLLTKIATAPFALLARLGGRDDEINQIDFAAGSSALDAAGQERMTALAKALGERPSLELDVPTAYSPDADGAALARAKLDARLPALAQTPEADEAARFELLRKQYEKELGAKTALPAPAVAVMESRKKKEAVVAYAAANDELTAALLAHQPASETELDELARARTEAVRTALLGSGDIDPKRVFVLGAKPVPAVAGKVRVELALK
jgi:hypothetical protein